MKKIKKISAILFFSVYLILGLKFTTPVLAADEVKFTPQIGIPGSEFVENQGISVGKTEGDKMTSDLLARYIKAFYNWGLSIVGVLAVLMLMAGGLIWLTSAGDSGKVENAKKMISGSLFGSLLLLGAYFFLNTVNPDLTRLPAMSVDNINNKNIGKPTTCNEATDSTNCANLGFCYWENNKCITKAESITESGGSLCSVKKSDIKEKYPQCCCEQSNYNYVNCKWSVTGKDKYCSSSCGNTYAKVNDSYCQN